MTTYTENFADMGARERGILIDILTAWNDNGLPKNFSEENVRPAFNTSSGNVFLVNGDYQVAMINGDTLEEFYTTPYEGHEGFLDDLFDLDVSQLHNEDIEYIKQIAANNDVELTGCWVNVSNPA